VKQSARACEKKRRSENEVGSLEEGKRVHGILVCRTLSRLVSLFFFVVNCWILEQFSISREASLFVRQKCLLPNLSRHLLVCIT
jgi:hypothetical protein